MASPFQTIAPRPQAPSARAALPLPARMAGPLRREELAPLPTGWRVGPPDFVGVGCAKAGTTWWWHLLSQHPGVFGNRLGEKELQHFCHFALEGPSEEHLTVYREAFAAPPGGISGEWSVLYLHHPLALRRLRAAAPGARILVALRNPIDRAVSAYNMFVQKRAGFFGLEPAREHVLRAFSLFPEALHGARSATELAELFALYRRDRVLVLQYEKMKRDPAGELARTLHFLGLEPEGRYDFEQPINRMPYVIERPDEATRRLLADHLREDVERTFELCPELDRSLWPDFA